MNVATEKINYINLEQLSEKVPYKKNTLYKKIKLMKDNGFCYKPNNGMLVFDDRVIDFLMKGIDNGKGISERKQSVRMDNLFH